MYSILCIYKVYIWTPCYKSNSIRKQHDCYSSICRLLFKSTASIIGESSSICSFCSSSVVSLSCCFCSFASLVMGSGAVRISVIEIADLVSPCTGWFCSSIVCGCCCLCGCCCCGCCGCCCLGCCCGCCCLCCCCGSCALCCCCCLCGRACLVPPNPPNCIRVFLIKLPAPVPDLLVALFPLALLLPASYAGLYSGFGTPQQGAGILPPSALSQWPCMNSSNWGPGMP